MMTKEDVNALLDRYRQAYPDEDGDNYFREALTSLVEERDRLKAAVVDHWTVYDSRDYTACAFCEDFYSDSDNDACKERPHAESCIVRSCQ